MSVVTRTSGEKDLQTLLKTMAPRLHPETFVFATVGADVDTSVLSPQLTFEEAEGTTLVLPLASALDHGIASTFRCRMITLDVHSSLNAVGFLAAITTALAAANISANAVSGFHHDHLFVPVDDTDAALAVLATLHVA